MNRKHFRARVFVVCLTMCLFTLSGCWEEGDSSVSANGSAINVEAQKAAQRFTDVTFIKCGESSYATDGGQIWELRNMKVVTQPEDPQIAQLYKEDRKRKEIDWYGDIHFECSSGRIYNFGWMNWGAGVCGYNSIQLVHQKGVWLYETGTTLEQWQKSRKPLSCEKIPR